MTKLLKRLALTAATLTAAMSISMPASAALVTYTQSMSGFSYNSDVVNGGFNAALGAGYTHLSFQGAGNTNGASYSSDLTFSTKAGVFGGSNTGSVNAAGEIGPFGSWDGILNISVNSGFVSSMGFGLVVFNTPVEHIRVYNDANVLIGSFNNQLSSTFSLWGVSATAGEHIGRIELDGNFFAIQDISYGASVPEPGTMLLLGLGLLGLGATRRRKA